ncbi:hypothetical protein TUM20983_09750 [Mycobacterium antarcticum]|uniref:DUF2330 domain-containing protein n=1 Tax=unclassified Mycolicibacterium TaxID=2636767 RepID=UPI00239FFF94|nr:MULTISPECIES: DUF2330 domain-containing protein [unclassified Mycolicibacterium]GLP73865.1 hypothetical protein TUM20983_09750 [Mycolicibacterium sp. TUM20983]GLP79549.1 hypothetical protein TUM20984_09690 [Mycolicibacterium sp. TUM20984]
MRSIAALMAAAVVLSLTAAPASACACGGFVSSDANASPGDELALIHWDGRVETLIMQLGLESNADDAALVVPTPTPAVAASASPALFEELRAMTAPRVEHTWQWWPDTGGGDDTAGARGGPGAPTALAQVQLGPIEATTLTGGDLDGLTSWLTEHGYVMRSEMLASLAPYTREGWSFVAMRLTSPQPLDGALDPVKLTFDADRLVYPMRMSAAARDAERVRLYAVSEHRLQRTDPDAAGQYTDYPFAGWVRTASDADLAEMIGGSAFLTEMYVDVYDPSRITSDFTFERAPQDTEYRAVVHETTDVSGYVVLAGVALIVIAIVLLAVVLLWRRRRVARPLLQ